MRNVVSMFRLFLILSLLLGLAAGVVDLVVPRLLPAALSDAYDAYTVTDPSSAQILVVGLLAIVVFFVGIVAMVGLYFLKPWSRSLSLWVTVASLVMYPALGPSLSSGWSELLFYASSAFWGAVLAMSYYSKIADNFQRS